MRFSKATYLLVLSALIVLSGIWIFGKGSAPRTPAIEAAPSPVAEVEAPPPVPAPAPSPSVTIGQMVIPVELAVTPAAQTKGLSGRASLGKASGMLFIFDKAGIYRFWMPDMRFPIDIIWINNGKVVDISAKVSNKFDPASPRFYSPKVPARYVLEVNAGFAAAHHIKAGDPVTLNGIQKGI